MSEIRYQNASRLFLCFLVCTFSLLFPKLGASQTLSASLEDEIVVDENNDSVANAGETIRYSLIVKNNGSTTLTGVTADLSIDDLADTVPGSINFAPIATDDSYVAIGNFPLVVNSNQGLIVPNDSDPTNDPLFIDDFDSVSSQGGTVSVSTDGSFIYESSPSFVGGTDTFGYTLSDSRGTTDTATVSITVAKRIWYVNNTATTAGVGSFNDPFRSLSSAELASQTGEMIFVFRGDGTPSFLDQGIQLKNNQSLIGQGIATPVVDTINGQTITLLPSGAPPTIINDDTPAISLAVNNTISGIQIGSSTFPSGGIGIFGNNNGNLNISRTSIYANAPAVSIDGGALDVNLSSITSINSFETGLRVNNSSGTFTVSGSTTLTNTFAEAIILFGNSANITLQNAIVSTNGPEALVASESTGLIKIDSGSMATIDNTAINISASTIDISLTTVSATPNIRTVPVGIALGFITGSFQVTGVGSTPGSGGTISSSEGSAISVTDIDTISLNYMNLQGSNNHGVDTSGIDNLTLRGLSITDSGNNGLRINTGLGDSDTLIQQTTVNSSSDSAINITASSGGLQDITISNSTVSGAAASSAPLVSISTDQDTNSRILLSSNNFNSTGSGPALDIDSGSGGALLSLTANSNIASVPSNGNFDTIRVTESGNSICASINSTQTTAANGLTGIKLNQNSGSFALPNFNGDGTSSTAINNFVIENNPQSTADSTIGSSFSGGTACELPN